VRVSATNAAGEVFVGVANPVDAASYLDGVKRLDISEVTARGEIRGKTVDGKLAAPAVSPQKVDFWLAKASGAGEQSVTVPLRGDALNLVVLPVGKAGDLSLGLAWQVAGIFRLALVVAVVGLALLVGSMLLRRRDNTRRKVVAAGVPTAGGSPSGLATSEAGRSTPVALLGSAVAAALVLAGCVSLPQQVPVDDVAPTTTGFTARDAASVLKDYDARSNAAIKAATTKYDTKAWANADTGVALAGDQFQTALAKALATREKPAVITHTPMAVYTPSFDRYPVWSMVVTKVTNSLDSKDEAAKAKAARQLCLMVRASPSSPWLLAGEVDLSKPAPPRALAAGAPSTATDVDRRAAMKLVENFRDAVSRGAAPTFTVDAGVREVLDIASGKGATKAAQTQLDVNHLDTRIADQTGPGGSVQVVKVHGGTLVFVSQVGRYTQIADSDTVFSWVKGYAEVLQETGRDGSISAPTGVMAAFLVTPKGAQALGGGVTFAVPGQPVTWPR
jgi:hypothetical protein